MTHGPVPVRGPGVGDLWDRGKRLRQIWWRNHVHGMENVFGIYSDGDQLSERGSGWWWMQLRRFWE